jgi:hypothetical protein
MCKHCVVGVGAAEATLRLPPSVYREKIWDHVAGEHFVRETGGRVTDLRGRALSFEGVRRIDTGDEGTSWWRSTLCCSRFALLLAPRQCTTVFLCIIESIAMY